MLFHVFQACPIAEIGEGEMSSGVVLLEKILEGGMGILDPDSPTLQNGLSVHEFLLAESALVVRVQFVEGKPQMIVQFEVDEEISELSLRYVVISKGVFGFDLVLGGCVGPDDDWLGIEEFRQSEHIANSLVDFCQAEIAIVVHVEIFVDEQSFCSILGGKPDGDLLHLLHG